MSRTIFLALALLSLNGCASVAEALLATIHPDEGWPSALTQKVPPSGDIVTYTPTKAPPEWCKTHPELASPADGCKSSAIDVPQKLGH